ncbi:MAG: hypothetical protein M1541_05075, partial [Acidobacteria bacterium]|nr:hypothetical protein [Acidobacteriota bacterium]
MCLCAPAEAQTIRWARQFGTSGTEIAYAVAATGNSIYVAGEITNGAFPGFTNAGGREAFVAKFDPQGNLLWVRQFGSAGEDTALGIAANADAVYVVGRTSGVLPEQAPSGNTDAFVRRYAPDGTQGWTRQFGTSGIDEAFAVTIIPAGLYIVGRTNGTFPGQTSGSPGTDDAFVTRFDQDGSQWWTRQFGTTGGDRAYGVAADSTGAYVAGYTQGALVAPPAGTDAFLRKYDDGGNVLWTRQISSAGSANDIAYGVTARFSEVYLCGDTTGVFAGQNRVGGSDAWAQKYDANGTLQWTRQFGSSANDTGYGIAVANWVYVAGTAGDRDAMLQRFNINGGEPAFLEFDPATADYAFAVATDGTGAYLAGTKNGDSLGQVSLGGGDAFLVKVTHPPLITGIADAFTGQPGLASSTWISLYGENLSESTRTWDGAINGSQLPKSLNNVSIDVNGRPATVYFISPQQVNILPPLDEAIGDIRVTLRNDAGVTSPFQVLKSVLLPAFYAPFGDDRGLAMTAVALDGTLIGTPGLDPRVHRSARPGELVLVFATGFGAEVHF